MEALLQWAVAHGCQLPRVAPHHTAEQGWGMQAATDVPAGTDVIVVPLALLIHEQAARECTALATALADAGVVLADGTHWVYAFMLHERAKGPAGLWWPYWASLPAPVPTPPAWSDAELDVARGTNLWAQVQAIRAQMAALSAQLAPLVAARPDVLPRATPADCLWCYQVFWSRALAVLWPPGDATRGCLVPVADLLNHSPTARVAYLTHFDAGVFSVRQEEAVPAGAPVHLNYGSRSAEKMLLNYGFVDPPPFAANVLTFNERASIVDGDCSSVLAEVRRVCDGDETDALMMLYELLDGRLRRMAVADAAAPSLLAAYARDQRALLEGARTLLFTQLLPALWEGKPKPEQVRLPPPLCVVLRRSIPRSRTNGTAKSPCTMAKYWRATRGPSARGTTTRSVWCHLTPCRCIRNTLWWFRTRRPTWSCVSLCTGSEDKAGSSSCVSEHLRSSSRGWLKGKEGSGPSWPRSARVCCASWPPPLTAPTGRYADVGC